LFFGAAKEDPLKGLKDILAYKQARQDAVLLSCLFFMSSGENRVIRFRNCHHCHVKT
jgi:hypothetical protein